MSSVVTDFEYVQGANIPPIPLLWEDNTGAPHDYSSGWTFTFEILGTTFVTKTAGIVGYDTSPNVVVNFDPGELDDLDPGAYWCVLTATDVDNNEGKFRFSLGIIAAN